MKPKRKTGSEFWDTTNVALFVIFSVVLAIFLGQWLAETYYACTSCNEKITESEQIESERLRVQLEEYKDNRETGTVRTGERVYFERGAIGTVGGWMERFNENIILVSLQHDGKPKNTYLEICALTTNRLIVSTADNLELFPGDCYSVRIDSNNPETKPLIFFPKPGAPGDTVSVSVKEY